ncbi:hypothetical protein KY285_007011 [Solanum tuberosum]|nr:hypothetical protein KY285_007011 [Solanum tuberosum]
MKTLGCIDELSGCATLEKLKKVGCVVGNPNPTYQREVDVFGVGIDKDHFGLVELLSYTKDLGYTNVKGIYCEDNNELVQVTSDTQLLEFVKDLVDDLNGVDTELPRGDTNQNKVKSDIPSSDTDVDVIPDEDDSNVDEESLRA